MKYVLYAIAVIIGFFLFIPESGSTEIRNVPLLILIVSLIILSFLIRFFKHVALMRKTEKLLRQNGVKSVQTTFFPWDSRFRGRYSMTFQHEDKSVQIAFLCRQRKYQRYHFDKIDQLEFYNTNRVVFKGTKIKGATISNAIETNLVGKQKLKWDKSAVIRMILFDKLPEQITDSASRQVLAAGDQICGSDIYICNWEWFGEHIRQFDL